MMLDGTRHPGHERIFMQKYPNLLPTYVYVRQLAKLIHHIDKMLTPDQRAKGTSHVYKLLGNPSMA